MAQSASDLIYDVGLHNGEDTANYLARGYRVIAVDANPVMVDSARSRFSCEIREGRLVLLNVGISRSPGIATFWVSAHSDWSSFDRTIASRDGTEHRAISVPVVPFSRLVGEYGIPHYLKIDIEGSDNLCVEALSGLNLPKYISVEAECVGDSVQLTDSRSVGTLNLLGEVGYRNFKLVDQRNRWRSVRPGVAAQYWNRLLDSASYGRMRFKGLSRFAARFTDFAHIERLGFDYAKGSSGPWGDDVPGEWMTFETARSVYLRERRRFFASGRSLYDFWYDWHATY